MDRERRAFRGRRHDLVREPDAGDPHVRFDERRLETESWRGVRHRHRAKAAGNSYPHPPTATAPVVDSTRPHCGRGCRSATSARETGRSSSAATAGRRRARAGAPPRRPPRRRACGTGAAGGPAARPDPGRIPRSPRAGRPAVRIVAAGRSTGVAGFPEDDDWTAWNADEMRAAVEHLQRKRGA